CGPNSGCHIVNGSPLCFCLPEYEGNPPSESCHLPSNPCDPSPCGPNTQCAILSNGFAKCTCLPGFLESPNTIRGCVRKHNPCQPNPCGSGAICDPNKEPQCSCPESSFGNPYQSCHVPVISLCQPGPCGSNADCYITGNQESCYCKSGYKGDPYSGCISEPPSPCLANPCGPNAICTASPQGYPMCVCPDGISGDPTGPTGCGRPECRTDDNCTNKLACIAYSCRDPCPGSCGIGASCRVEKHHPVCTCNHGLTGNPLIRCSPLQGE
ncbi:Putative fat-like cadherin-related tumor suppressor-like protein, partial [Zootermopsis nevadensis]